MCGEGLAYVAVCFAPDATGTTTAAAEVMLVDMESTSRRLGLNFIYLVDF